MGFNFSNELDKEIERTYREKISRAIEVIPSNAGNKEIKIDLAELAATHGDMSKIKNLLALRITEAGMDDFKKETIRSMAGGKR